ncbi:NAD-dependent epimerase/dehydratase family protein [Arthrobacter mobilis]|uniref:NAD-dependent epimerase/dehydratase family protein n=1 Tax=Arthrobacter mobilis TaxID=2724944 RepID=A0A7X6HC56_9MICC|nr:NAD-dependent epimerase/dehydratase family protein [Arthrobacter mobilis]NKX53027.1 NAD-dependent epimerase/dehydratase family protein [Arthrobacter mobilis]
MSQHYLVTGAGPVGSTVALQLVDTGHTVTLASRSGSGPDHPRIHRIQADAMDAARLEAAMDDAAAVFHCIHAPYTAKAWREVLPRAEQLVLDAAGRQGIPVVFPESLYSYSEPQLTMREDSPRRASGGKRGVRTALLEARAAAAADTVSVVAADFYGPFAMNAHAGEHMLSAVFGGRRLAAVGNPDAPHSFTYVPDLAAAMIRAAQRPELWNRVLHAPTAPTTQRAMVEAYARAAGLPAPKVSGIPGWVLRVLGAASRDMRELAEVAYQFDAPFVMDSTRSEAELGLSPTPLAEGAAATVAWWRNRQPVPAA